MAVVYPIHVLNFKIELLTDGTYRVTARGEVRVFHEQAEVLAWIARKF